MTVPTFSNFPVTFGLPEKLLFIFFQLAEVGGELLSRLEKVTFGDARKLSHRGAGRVPEGPLNFSTFLNFSSTFACSGKSSGAPNCLGGPAE